MGLLDQLWGGVRNAAAQQNSDIPHMLLAALGGGNDEASKAQGLSALISRFQQAGLGNIVQSWISNEQKNQPVSADQVQHALGDHVDGLAQRAGMPKSALLSALAAMLPQVIDSMTPNGQPPKAPDTAPLQRAGVGAAPDQAPGEAEAPREADGTAAQAAVNRTDPTEPTQSGA